MRALLMLGFLWCAATAAFLLYAINQMYPEGPGLLGLLMLFLAVGQSGVSIICGVLLCVED